MADKQRDERRRERGEWREDQPNPSESRETREEYGNREYPRPRESGRERWNPDVERSGREFGEGRYGGPYNEDYRSPSGRYGGQEYDEGRMTTYRGRESQGRGWEGARSGWEGQGGWETQGRGGWGEGPGGSQGGTRWGQGSVAGQSMGWTEGMRGPHTGRGPKNYKRSDERICEDINERLTEHGEIDATNIECSVKDAVATLSGTVESRRIRRMAEEVVENIPGVKDVQNQLRVEGGQADERTMAAGGASRRARESDETERPSGSSRRNR